MDFNALGKVLLVFGIAVAIAFATYAVLTAVFGLVTAGLIIDVITTIFLVKVLVWNTLKKAYEDFKDTPYK
ncbi:hypothetical protein [Enterococcus phage vB_EfaS_Ef7.1]|nr:hypothetical protein [Enterococcus phage vB_EfaS_Ef7.1]